MTTSQLIEKLVFEVHKVKFNPGRMVSTRGAAELPPEETTEALWRHLQGDWGEMDAEDCSYNEQSLLDGSRLMSAYRTSKGVRFWIISDATDDPTGFQRPCTTILLPEEY